MKNNISLLKGLGIAALLTAALPSFAATTYTNVTEVFPPDPIAGQFYGVAVAMNDDVAVVGAPFNYSPFQGRPPFDGAAYVYAKTNGEWILQQKLTASDGAATNTGLGNQFGIAIAIAGNTLVVGAPSRRVGGKTGAVYVFKRSETDNTWTEESIVTSSTPRPLGTSVALRGNTLVAGALEDHLSSGGPSDTGVAFVFRRSGNEWLEEGNLITSDVQPQARYGSSVDVRGNTVVVGAVNPFTGDPSAVYVFSRQGGVWTEETKLSSANNSRAFGNSVSLWGASLAVGDPASSTVSIYEHIGPDWQLTQTLAGTGGTEFGCAVSQKEDRLLIGAQRTTVGEVVSGAAYLYGFDQETSTWTLNQMLTPADGQTFDLFGAAVTLNGAAAIVGAPRHTHSTNPQSGSAYIHEP